MKKAILKIIVFTTGGVIMVYELVGSRVLAPYVGTSLFVWTSLIGIILGSLSLGYAWGGRLADKKLSHSTLSAILLVAGIFVGLTTVSNKVVLALIIDNIIDIRLAASVAAIILFMPASVALGMVSPYVIRLHLSDLKSSGRVVGTLYALSTLGSIAGTFLAGFWLIPFFGTTRILLIIMIMLGLAALLVGHKQLAKTKIIFLILVISILINFKPIASMFSNPNLVDVDTAYNRIWIADIIDRRVGRPMRMLVTDPHGIQGGIYLDDPLELALSYSKFFRLSYHFSPNAKSALLIGGGTYSIPGDFVRQYTEAKLTVVELDPKVTELAREHFYFEDNERITIRHRDGRVFLNQSQDKFDIVYLDAYGSHISVPFHLTTAEALTRIYESLNDNGIVVANLVSGLIGEKGKFFLSELKTYKSVFPEVMVFPVNEPENLQNLQNIVLIAFKNKTDIGLISEDQEISSYLSNYREINIDSDAIILTDDYAPVDYYTLNLL